MRHDLVVAYLDAQHENKAQEIVAVSCLIRLIFVLRTTRNFHEIFLYCQLSENLRNIVIICVEVVIIFRETTSSTTTIIIKQWREMQQVWERSVWRILCYNGHAW